MSGVSARPPGECAREGERLTVRVANAGRAQPLPQRHVQGVARPRIPVRPDHVCRDASRSPDIPLPCQEHGGHARVDGLPLPHPPHIGRALLLLALLRRVRIPPLRVPTQPPPLMHRRSRRRHRRLFGRSSRANGRSRFEPPVRGCDPPAIARPGAPMRTHGAHGADTGGHQELAGELPSPAR